MQIFFKTRNAARASIPAAKLVDNGKDAAKRWAKDISGIKATKGFSACAEVAK